MSTTLTEFVGSKTAAPATNTVLDDLVAAVSNYPHEHLTIDIFGVGTVNGGDQINEGDEVAFHVRVNNSGPLDVLDLVLTIAPGPGATGVKTHDGKTFSTKPLSTDPIAKIRGHQADGEWTEVDTDYHFLAGAASKNPVDLVTVSVDTWNGGTDHIFIDHSDPDAKAQKTYQHKVLGS